MGLVVAKTVVANPLVPDLEPLEVDASPCRLIFDSDFHVNSLKSLALGPDDFVHPAPISACRFWRGCLPRSPSARLRKAGR